MSKTSVDILYGSGGQIGKHDRMLLSDGHTIVKCVVTIWA